MTGAVLGVVAIAVKQRYDSLVEAHSTVGSGVGHRHLVLVGDAVRLAGILLADLVNVIKDINDVLRVHGVTDLQGVGLIPQHVVVPIYRQRSGNLCHTVFGSLAKSHSGTVRQQAAAVKLHVGRICDNRGIRCDLCLYTARVYQIVVYRIIRLGLEDVTEGIGLSLSQGLISRIPHIHIFAVHIMPSRVAAGITLQRQHSGGNSTFNLGLCPVLPGLGLITPLFQWHDDGLGDAGGSQRLVRGIFGDRSPRAAFHLVVNRGLVDVGSIIVVGVQSKIHSHLVIGFRTCNVAVASLIHYNAVEEVVPTGCLPRKIVTGKVRCDRLIRNRRTQLTAARLGHLRIVRVFPTCFGVEVVLHRVRNRIRMVGDSVRNIVLDLSRNTIISQSTLHVIRCSPGAVGVVRVASAGGNILFRQRIAAGGTPLAVDIGQNDLDRLVNRTCLRSIPGTIHNRKCHRLDAVLRRGELCLSPDALQLHAVTVNGDRSTIHGITRAIDLPAAKGIAGDSVSSLIQLIQHFALEIVGINGMLISVVQGCIIRRLLQSMRRATVFIQRSIFRQAGPCVAHLVRLFQHVSTVERLLTIIKRSGVLCFNGTIAICVPTIEDVARFRGRITRLHHISKRH